MVLLLQMRRGRQERCKYVLKMERDVNTYGRFETSVAPMRRGLYGRTSALLLSARKWCRKRPPLVGGGIKLGLLLDDDDEQTEADNRSRDAEDESAVFFWIYGDFNALIIFRSHVIVISRFSIINCSLFPSRQKHRGLIQNKRIQNK